MVQLKRQSHNKFYIWRARLSFSQELCKSKTADFIQLFCVIGNIFPLNQVWHFFPSPVLLLNLLKAQYHDKLEGIFCTSERIVIVQLHTMCLPPYLISFSFTIMTHTRKFPMMFTMIRMLYAVLTTVSDTPKS